MYDPISQNIQNVPMMDRIDGFIMRKIPYGESLGEIGEMLRERFDASGAAVADKTSQIMALMGVFAAPVVIILVLFIGKIAYDVFTGAADSIGDALLIARYKIKTFFKLVFAKIRSLISPGA